jgi:23S rRNA (adenine2503-C2)-methyltransferase
MKHWLDQTPAEIKAWMTERGLPGYRGEQVRRWVFERAAGGFDEMTDLPRSLRSELAEAFTLFSTSVARHRRSDDGTQKLLLRTGDGQQIECVLLRDDRQHCTACISTQVGCAMGCVFCASGLDGLVRNLTAGEILEQMLQLKRLLDPEERLSHLVVMGMGEPLANLDALLPALAVATDPAGLGIGVRRVTISTVGLPAAIRRLAKLDRAYHLAVSLHAADDALRDRLVPANRKVGIAAILEAADDYFATSGRRLTYEYVLLADLNDRPEQARRLVGLLRGRPALVNVIAYNPVADLPYRTPTTAALARFVEILREGGLSVQVRYRKGDRIDAACGQLRRGRPIGRECPLEG